MYIEVVRNRNSPPAILLRESWREGKKVYKRTLANLSKWPAEVIEGLRVLLRGGTAVDHFEQSFTILRSRPHGHVAAVLGSVRRLGLDALIAPQPSRLRQLVLAMIVARLLDPASKLATARSLGEETQLSTLGELLEVQSADADELYAALDMLLANQPQIEAQLAKRHLVEGSLVLYDVTSTYFEGHCCPLARYGHSRDGKKKLQIVLGLLCSRDGCPVAVQVFEGNTADAATLGAQVQKLKEAYGLAHVVLVGDRGMLTQARLREDLHDTGFDWITALRAPALRQLLQAGVLQLSLFDEQDMAEITSPEYPEERLIVCRNPFMTQERAHTRRRLLEATEQHLDKVVAATQRPKRPLRGEKRIALRVGRVLNRFKVGKHFSLAITDTSFAYQRDAARIAEEAALDGFYIIRTSVPRAQLSAAQTVRAYKGLSAVERAFRSCKTVDLKVRPIYHRLPDRVRAHVFLCMLAYYVEWHMRQALAPLLFDDEDKAQSEALRASVVAPAQPSPSAQRKARTKRTEQDMPVHSFQTLLADLATITTNRIQAKLPNAQPFDQITNPTALQKRALDLLGVRL